MCLCSLFSGLLGFIWAVIEVCVCVCVCVHVWVGVHDGGCGTITHKHGSLRKCTPVQGKMTQTQTVL